MRAITTCSSVGSFSLPRLARCCLVAAPGPHSPRMDAASAHRPRDTAPAAPAVRSPLRARALQGNIPSIKSLLVLDSDGKRIISR